VGSAFTFPGIGSGLFAQKGAGIVSNIATGAQDVVVLAVLLLLGVSLIVVGAIKL